MPTKEELDKLYPNLTDEEKEDIIKSAKKRAEKAAAAPATEEDLLYKVLKSTAGMEDGEEKNKKIYNTVATGLNDYVAKGNYSEVDKMRRVVEQAGGDLEYFDNRVMVASKAALKKSIKFNATSQEINQQARVHDYLTSHGMAEEEISSEIVYKSDGAKDLKAAFRTGDEDLMVEAARPLIQAGLTYEDFVRLYENRNRMDISKYDGRYKDLFESSGSFVWPTQGTITSNFGYRGDDPTLPAGASTNHPAIDIGAPEGSDVVAADGGEVIFVGWNGGYGKQIAIRHKDGTITYYSHLSWYDAKVGDIVAQGQYIGNVGNTGTSSGPHLDFKVEVNGEPVDPLKYLQEKGAT